MKKRTLAILLALSLVLSTLVGCGGNSGNVGGNAGNNSGSQSDTSDTNEADTGDTDAGNAGSTDADTTPAPEGPAIEQLTIGTTSAIETATREEYAYDMLASGTSELPMVYQDTTGSYHPLLVSFETDDAATWTYTVQEGMTWSDGTPVTAEDILFTLQYEDQNGSANFVDQTDSEGKTIAAKYTAYELSEDKMSISLTLAAANVRELSNMTSFRPMPKHIYEGKTELTDEDKRVGCGPYMLESFDKNAGTLTFVVNPYYPQTPNVGKLVYRVFSSEDVMYTALTAGDIDLCWNYSMGVPATYQSVLDAADSVALIPVAATNAPAVLAFNNANGPFADENLRLAVSYALNYDTFKEYFGSAYANVPNRGFVPTTTAGYKDTEPLKTDLAKAEEYLAAAGYTAKNADGLYVNDAGEVLGFTLTVNSGKETHVGYAELIKTQLEDFGIQVTLDAIDGDSYNAKTSNKFSENNITMEAAIYGYTGAGMGMGNGLATIYVDGTHAVQGGCQVFDPDFQAIRDEMAAAKTLDEYYAAAGKMQDWYAQHCPLVALYWDSMMLACSASYENVTADAVFGLNNVNNWFTITVK